MRILLLVFFVASVPASRSAEPGPEFDQPVGRHFLTAHGRYAWAGGFADGGLEIWAGALQIASQIQPEFRYRDKAAVISVSRIVAKIRVGPSITSRVYIGPDFTVEENIWVPHDQPAVFFRYKVRSTRSIQIMVRFQPSLNLMWPAAIGGQTVLWDAGRSAYLLREPTREFAAIVFAPGAIAHDEPHNDVDFSQSGNELAVALDSESPRIAFVRIQPEPSGLPMAFDSAAIEQRFASSQYEFAEYDQNNLTSDLQIVTPDENLNRALVWAEIDLDQDWLCNDRLGCGYVAGFGPSRRDRRPQYAWYFAGDGMVALHAALTVGDLDRARDELRFLAKFQDKNTGIMWHEISQSAPYLDWQNKYPYMFAHADLTYPYISAVADYIRRSNDREFLREIWPSAQKAFEYGQSLVSDDGLPRIPKEKEGANEQEALSDDLSLSAGWIQACDDYSFLSDLMADGATAVRTRKVAEKARAAFDGRYWDTHEDFAIQGYRLDGTAIAARGVGAIRAFKSHLFNQARMRTILNDIASWRFQSDWGTRGLAIGEPGFNPSGYVNGSVSALRTAEVAEAYWMAHRPVTAFQIWSALIPWFWLDSPGHMDELLRGDVYYPQSESVPEQTWSVAGFLSAAVHGLFGLDVKSADGLVALSPHLPLNWDHASLDHVRIGNSELSFNFHQSVGELTVVIDNVGNPVHLAYDPSIPLGSSEVVASVNGHRVESRVESYAEDLHCRATSDIPHGVTEIKIAYDGGIEILMTNFRPSIADASSSMKLTSVGFEQNVLRLGIDLVPATNNRLDLLTRRTIQKARYAEFKRLSSEMYEITIVPTESQRATEYHHQEVEISFGVK